MLLLLCQRCRPRRNRTQIRRDRLRVPANPCCYGIIRETLHLLFIDLSGRALRQFVHEKLDALLEILDEVSRHHTFRQALRQIRVNLRENGLLTRVLRIHFCLRIGKGVGVVGRGQRVADSGSRTYCRFVFRVFRRSSELARVSSGPMRGFAVANSTSRNALMVSSSTRFEQISLKETPCNSEISTYKQYVPHSEFFR